MDTSSSPGKFSSPRSGSGYKSWLDSGLALRVPQQFVANDWEQPIDSSSLDQTNKSKLRSLPRLQSKVTALKETIMRSAARLHPKHSQEAQGSWDYDADSQISSWKPPRDAVSMFSAKTRGLKDRLKSWGRIKKGTLSLQSDSQWESSDWETSDWETSNWEISNWETSNWETSNWETSNWETSNWETSNWETSNWETSNWETTTPHPQDYERFTPKLLDFIAPLQRSSLSQIPEERSFLRQFLSERRSINIHPERKHRLAMFLHRMCEEASYAYVAVQEPLALSLLCVHSADQVELSVWLTLIGNMRRINKSLGDGLSWPNPLQRTDTIESNSDNVSRLRHVAVHRWEYSSKLIEDVVAYLERLHDTDRRAQVEDALEELYHDECAQKSNQEVSLSSEKTVDSDQVSTGRPSTEDNGSSDGSSTLHNVSTWDDTLTKVDSSDEGSIWKQESFLDNITCTPNIGMPSSITTYQRLLRASQDILEKSLFNFAKKEFPSALIRYDFRSAAEVELNQYSSQFTWEIIHSLPNIPRDEVREILTAGARYFRNAGAHHEEYHRDLTDSSNEQIGWADGDPQQVAETLTTIEPVKDRNKQLLSDAQALAHMINDDSAVRELQILSWVADINIRAANGKIEYEESRRSLEEWEYLEKAAEVLMRDFKCTGQFMNGWHEGLYSRLEGNRRYFRDQATKLRD